MKFLVFGLGSMGKRRVRCLQALGYTDITGMDPREDRRLEASRLLGITTVDSLRSVSPERFDAFIISTPPDHHTEYARLAIDYAKPAFIEASVILEHVKEIQRYNTNTTFLAPSCTLRFHPVIKDITRIIKSGKYGKITNFSYHSGQYLPDWHPWEAVADFYVSNPATGGGREIVPFELTWMVDTLGWPLEVKGMIAKTIDTGAPIDDTYSLVLRYDTMVGNMVVDVASRFATRSLIINLEQGQLIWRWEDKCLKVYEAETNRWIIFQQPETKAAAGYNENIGEQMYIEEMKRFIDGIQAPELYPNSIDDDIKVLEILNQLELSDGGRNYDL